MKKSFGQNLLADKNYLNKIIDSINLSKDDIVLEIGAGTGLLTSLLAERVKKVFAVEMERDILKKLKENVRKLHNVEIIEENFLSLSIDELIKEKFKIVGNIPYNITSKILKKIFGDFDLPTKHLKFLKEVYLMVQLEVAKKITSNPGNKSYGSLSILIPLESS